MGKFFSPQVTPTQIGKTMSPAAVFLVKFDERFFILTFGGGRFLISSNCYEERFGLKVALNSLNDTKLRSIDKKTFDSISSHTRTQAIRESDVKEFGLDIERDLLKGVTGTPDDPSFGVRMSGMDALNVTVSADLDSLQTLLPKYYKKSQETTYKEKFPWVDQILDVADNSVIAKLNDDLILRLREEKFENIEMAVPQIVDFQNILRFRYGRGKNCLVGYDLNIRAFVSEVKSDLNVGYLQRKPVYAINENNTEVYNWTAYKCIYSETDLNGGKYILDNGKWYQINDTFLSDVKTDVENIDEYDKDLPLYDHDLDSCEGDYNDRVCRAPSDYAYFDKDLIYLGKKTKFELCDLFSHRKDFIHVKRYNSLRG
jgi:uncharacterized protein (TIGR04141 family)